MSVGDTASSFEVFVGRERECAQLRYALEETSEGRGQLFLISGEPGIGKTRLADQIAKLASERSVRVLWGRCWEGDGAPAYWPWIQIVRALIASLDPAGRKILESEHAAPMVETVAQIVPELFAVARRGIPHRQPARPDPHQSQFRLLDSVATLLKQAARLGSLAIFLDDLHDADSASLTMLRFVARELRNTGVLIVGTYRQMEVQRSAELSQQIGDLSREARPLPLAGLSSAEVAQFFNLTLGEQPDVASVGRLYEATAGNPLFVDGIVRSLIAQRDRGGALISEETFSAPHNVREAIGRRLAKLSEPARAVLEVAATIGNEFDGEICTRVKQGSREQLNSCLDEASRDGILVTLGQGRYRFAHALIRASIYQALDTNMRMRLHGAIGTAIEELYAQNLDAHLDELAHHFREAGIAEKAIDYSYRAGLAARAVFAYAAAVEHWRAAVALTEGRRDARRAKILFRLGEAEAFFIDPPRGIAHLEESLSLYRELNDEAWVASLNVTLGLALVFLADFAPDMNVARSLDYFRQAQQWHGPWAEKASPGWLHQGMAVALFQQVRIEEALTSARRAMEIWRAVSIPQWLQSGAHVVQLLSILGRHRESATMLREVMEALQGIRDPGVFNTVTWYAAWAQMTMLNPLEARRLFTMIVEREGMPPNQRERAFEFLVQTELQMGNLARARELATAHRTNPSFRSMVTRFDGDFERAAEMERTMIEWGRRTGHLWDVVTSLPSLAGALNLLGDPKQALEILEEAMQLYEPSNYWLETGVRPFAASLEVIAGRPDRAEAHLKVCREIVAQGENWCGREGLIHRAEGRLAAALGRPFKEHFERAIAIFKRYRLPFEEADTLVSWGSALRGIGDRAEADAKFDAAVAIYRHCGAGQRWIDRVEAARSKAPLASITPSPDGELPSSFRRDGDFWTIAHNGKTSRLRNIKGLGYLAHLLGRPGERVHVIDLVQTVERGSDAVGDGAAARGQGVRVERGLGDAGESLDAQALNQYRRRQSELRAELEAAQRDNDPGRVDAARHELELITSELSAAVGPRGRGRRAHSHTERARSLVTKHIRSGLDLIRRNDPMLASHLDRSIHTGTHCAYLPEASEKINWRF